LIEGKWFMNERREMRTDHGIKVGGRFSWRRAGGYSRLFGARPTALASSLLVLLGAVATEGLSADTPATSTVAEIITGARRDLEYEKAEYSIPMRDGVRLHTTVYSPRDREDKYPIMLMRTCYSCMPYGPNESRGQIGPSRFVENDGYIFVHQDVRGRWMSEGTFDNMRPHVPGDGAIDESSDTYDTIEWLLAHLPNHNGRVGMWGISYPGFYAAAALPEAHPALVAVSPQAPISDFFFDDFHHHGAYLLSYFVATATFGYQHQGPTDRIWYQSIQPHTWDGYKFYMDLGPLSNAGKYYGPDCIFWQQLVEHPNYDEYWQARSLLPHLHDIHTNVQTVGGLFDAEDLYGPLHIYRELERNNPRISNSLILGPWGHGDWSDPSDEQVVGNISFGRGINEHYQQNIEAPFFRWFLKGEGSAPTHEALVFDTGRKVWNEFAQWPPAEARDVAFYVRAGERLTLDPPTADEPEMTEYISDPREPVPDDGNTSIRFTPRPYMTGDQRFAERRPDVIEFQTDVLTEDLTLAGDLVAELYVSTSGTDSDWVVKLIDVYPDDTPNVASTPAGVRLAGYQQMVRSDVMRGRFRNSYEHPEPFTPNEITLVKLPLQDVMHTFPAGHRIMIQIQSTWFPLIDRNPQTFVPNIFKATEADFVKATQRVYHTPDHATVIRAKQLGSPAK